MKNQEVKNGAWIEIARVGRFKDSGGNWQDFSLARLEKIARTYDPAKNEAPLVLGHPSTNGPACGWTVALKIVGEKLLAYMACVSEEIKAAVDNGLYKYVSMSLYPDGRLRHIGLLGAVPPAIDSLKAVSFSDEAAITINFAEGEQMTIEELLKQVTELQAALAAMKQEKDEALKKQAETETALEKSKADGEKITAEFSTYRDGQEKAALSARLEKAVNAGKLTPAERPAAEKTAEALRQAAKVTNFSSGNENPLETYLQSIESRPVSALFAAAASLNFWPGKMPLPWCWPLLKAGNPPPRAAPSVWFWRKAKSSSAVLRSPRFQKNTKIRWTAASGCQKFRPSAFWGIHPSVLAKSSICP